MPQADEQVEVARGERHSYLGVLIDLLTFLSDIGIPLFACLFPTGRFLPRWTAWLALGYPY